jgi:uncharacterized protein YjbI with pentapeptide repeats
MRGKRVWLDPKIDWRARRDDRKRITALGGILQDTDAVDARLDYLVLAEVRRKTPGKSQAERQVAKLSGANITTIYHNDLAPLLAATRDDALDILRAGPDHERKRRFHDLQNPHGRGHQIDLNGADFTGFDLRGFEFFGCLLDGLIIEGARLDEAWLLGPKNIDFTRAASLDRLRLAELEACTFDGLDLARFSLGTSMKRCTFRGTKLHDVRFTHGKLQDCDLTGADCTGGEFRHGEATNLRAEKVNFTGGNCEGTHWPGAKLQGSTFTGARMDQMDLTGADLRDCNLENANLSGTNLSGADLRGANLRNATLSDANLTDAKVAGADFTGANLRGAVGVPVKGCPGLAAALQVAPEKGELLQQLEAGLADAREWDFAFEVHSPTRGIWKYKLSKGRYGNRHYLWTQSPATDSATHDQVPDAFATLVDLAASFSDGVPQLDSATLRPLKLGKPLQQLALRALCETFGQPIPELKDIGKVKQAAKATVLVQRDAVVEQLKQGGDAVAVWNARPAVERRALGDFTGVDLSGVNLAGINFYKIDLRGANLAGADLSGADLRGANLRKTNLSKANMRKAIIRTAHCQDADASGANFAEADLSWSNWRGASLKNADLRKAKLRYFKVRGADLTGVKLTGAQIMKAEYDGDTKFPTDFTLDKEWLNKSKNPAAATIVVPPKEDLDFATFYAKVGALVDRARLSKAVSMLKAEKFQLFAEVDADQAVGIVRSQSCFGIYSCRLTRQGQFACVTDGLNTCGGLKGAVCKHLLVLILGLTKAGQFDPGTAHQWLQMSKQQRQTTDKNSLAETLLKYKGVQAGEVDWRPTETVPEDYYAL